MSAGPPWARIRVIGDESIEYTRRIGRIPLAHGEQVEVDLVRRDVFETGELPAEGVAERPAEPRIRPGPPEVRLVGIRLGVAEAELVGQWIRTAVRFARSALAPEEIREEGADGDECPGTGVR